MGWVGQIQTFFSGQRELKHAPQLFGSRTLDLRRVIIVALVKNCKLRPAECADEERAAQEFCRRFGHKPPFNRLPTLRSRARAL